MTTIPITTADDRDLARCFMIGKMAEMLEQSAQSVLAMAEMCPPDLKPTADSFAAACRQMARLAQESIA